MFSAPLPESSKAAAAAERVACVIVTRDRPVLLADCLRSIEAQSRLPDLILVVDNASGPETRTMLSGREGVRVLRLPQNVGGAGGFHAGIVAALECGADWLWLMDDDGRPHRSTCLESLIGIGAASEADLIGPLVVDVDQPQRLSFPIRVSGRTRFATADVEACGTITGFVHLFNGSLISAALFHRIGMPDARFFIRGDEVEFLLRARRSGARIVLDTSTHFLHPGSHAEITPIMGGLFYAVVPKEPVKQYYQFRNRAFIFLHYGMWLWLVADIVRYAYYYFVCSRFDVQGFASWLEATGEGWSGRFMRADPGDRPSIITGQEATALRLPGAA